MNSTIIAQPKLSDIYRLNPTTEKSTFLPSSQGTFTKIGNVLYYETQFNEVKRLKITQSIFSDQNGIKLEINNRRLKNPQIDIKQHISEWAWFKKVSREVLNIIT